MKKIVLSSFEKFGPYRKNIGALVAGRLNQKAIGGFHILSVQLPCDIPQYGNNRGKALLEWAHTISASAVLSLGMTSLCPGFWFETRARNLLRQPKYYPNPKGALVDVTRPHDDVLYTDLNPWKIKEFALKVKNRNLGIAEMSHDIGGFCCEHLVYQVLAAQKNGMLSSLPFAFLHLPCCPEAVENAEGFCRNGEKMLLSVDAAIKGIEMLLETAEI